MSDESEMAAPGAGGGAEALGIALTGASRARADAFLDKQSRVVDLQIEHLRNDHLREEQRLNLSHLRLRRFGDYAKMALEIGVGLVVLVFAGWLAAMIWNATQDRDLVIEAFSVPPDLAARGLTGAVVA